MTNEELAKRIYQGEVNLTSQLYQQNKGLLHKYCRSFYNRCAQRYKHCGVELCDLENECYFALLEAVKVYNEKPGYQFATCLRYPLINRMRDLAGFRVKTKGMDPLNNCDSLDTPVRGEDEDICLGDAVVDAAAEFEADILQRVTISGVFPAMRSALADTPKYGDILFMRYGANKTLDDIAAAYGRARNNIRQHISNAMRILRDPKQKAIRAYYDDIIGAAYHMSSLQHFRNTGASSTEWAALKPTAENNPKIIV